MPQTSQNHIIKCAFAKSKSAVELKTEIIKNRHSIFNHKKSIETRLPTYENSNQNDFIVGNLAP